MKLKLEATILPGERAAALTIGLNGRDEEVTLSAEDLDDIISLLGSARMAVEDEVPRRLEPSSKVRSIENPVLHVHKTEDGGTALCVRDPAYGWSAVTLSADAVQRLIAALEA